MKQIILKLRSLLLLAVLIIVIFVAKPVRAQMQISEVAWMGTATSANDEWIELYNDSSATVDLSGWSLTAADGSPEIQLSGMVSANGFFMLERSDDTSAPGVTADIIYTGALSNSGESLTLTDGQGNAVENLAAASGWPGGDAAQKFTLQKVNNIWVTGAPTPAAANSGNSTGVGVDGVASSPSDNTSNGSARSNTNTNQEPKPVWRPVEGELYPEDVMFVGRPANFDLSISTNYGLNTRSGHMTWNFGDGTTFAIDDVRAVDHIYAHPGTYTVTAAYRKRKNNAKPEVILEAEVNVQWFDVVISGVDPATHDVFITNNTPHAMDISRWRLVNGDQVYVFPENSKIASGVEVILSDEATGLNFGAVFALTLETDQKVVVDRLPRIRGQASQSPDLFDIVPKQVISADNTIASSADTVWRDSRSHDTSLSMSAIIENQVQSAIEDVMANITDAYASQIVSHQQESVYDNLPAVAGQSVRTSGSEQLILPPPASRDMSDTWPAAVALLAGAAIMFFGKDWLQQKIDELKKTGAHADLKQKEITEFTIVEEKPE